VLNNISQIFALLNFNTLVYITVGLRGSGAPPMEIFHTPNHFPAEVSHNHDMTYELLTALTAFGFVATITPGPNNLMLMASGANFGFRRTIPHMAGVNIGFTVMVLLIGIGIKQLFDAYPNSYEVLKYFSIGYLLYLAYRIMTAAEAPKADETGRRPFSFLQAAAFQWVNPKAWTMALTATAIYSPSRTLESIALVALVFGLINLPCITVWTAMGQQISRFLTSSRRLKAFNFLMAALLVGSLYPVLFSNG
jgi:threonine/homoserine/homoserine lactone efflux protein